MTVDHDLSATLALSSMLFVNPKYLQRSERNTFRDFTRYHVGGSVMARKALATTGTRSVITLGLEAVLPPPEEDKDVKTAIEAAQEEKRRKK